MHLDPSIPPVEVTEAPKRRGLLSIFSGANWAGFVVVVVVVVVGVVVGPTSLDFYAKAMEKQWRTNAGKIKGAGLYRDWFFSGDLFRFETLM